jgi:hypothetical protein
MAVAGKNAANPPNNGFRQPAQRLRFLLYGEYRALFASLSQITVENL